MDSEFISLVMANQRKIYSYIVHFVPNRADSDDIFQETVALMWEKFEEFEKGTNFAAWGTQIAHYKILKLKRRTQNRLIKFDSDIVDLIQEFIAKNPDNMDSRVEFLRDCIKETPETQRSLLAMRYDQELSVKKISKQTGGSIHSIYKALGRTYKYLLGCIRRKMSLAEDLT